MSNNTPVQPNSFNSTRYQIAIVVLIAALIISVAGIASGYYYFSNIYTKPVEQDVQKEPPVIEVTKDPELSSDQYYISSSRYESEESDVSKINKEEKGKLYDIKHDASGARFMTAVSQNSSIALNPGWSIKKIGEDPMWIPGACAQKPSWMVKDRYIMVDDGTYSDGKAMHYYTLYDTTNQKFTYFGGSLISETQNEENILFENIEGDNIVFYVDLKDASGIFSQSTNFKHATKNKESFIIRRVINPDTLEYIDYKIPYETPPYSVYFTDIVKIADAVKLVLNTDGHKDVAIGDITPNETVSLKKMSIQEYYESIPANSAPFGSHRENIINELRKTPMFSYWEGDPGDVLRYNTTKDEYIAFHVSSAPSVFNTKTGKTDFSLTEAGYSKWFESEAFTLGAFKQ